MREYGIWLEVTTLIVPGVNDDSTELEEIAGFIAGELGKDTPWHISRFFPLYKLNHLKPTPSATLERAARIGRSAGLNYIYPGNMGKRLDTCCPSCGAVVISRSGFHVEFNRVEAGGFCPACAKPIAGVGMVG
jgi:pyruvate formate lyase activating enzyme